MTVSDIPLLNDYKKKFVFRRIPQTLFGGLNTGLGGSAPWYSYGYRIILWFLPWLVGSMFVIAVEVAELEPLYASVGYGLFIGICVLFLQITSRLLAQRRNEEIKKSSDVANDPTFTSETGSRNTRMLLSEDDEVDFDSCCSVSTFLYIIPPKRYYINIVFHAMLSSLLCGLGLWYNLPSVISTSFGTNTAAGWIIFIFSWITICISHFPLLIGIPVPEVASYRLVSIYETQNAWRAIHALLFLLVFLVNLIITSSTLSTVSSILHIVFCTLPILWLVGIVPPIDALFLWSMEQFLIFGLGGSSMTTDLRLFLMVLMSSSTLAWTSFLLSPLALVGCCAILGYILSTDVTSIVILVFSKLWHAIAQCVSKNTSVKEYNNGESTNNKEPFQCKFTWKICLQHVTMLILCAAGSVLCRNYVANINVDSLRSVFNYVFITMFVLVLLTKHIQRVYVFFRIFRNNVYPFSTLPKASFNKKKMRLHIVGYLHTALLRVLFPLLATVYLGFFVFPQNTRLPSFLFAFGTIHATRYIWQRPGNAVFTFLIASILDLIPSVTSSPWGSLTLGTQLLILDLCRDRFFQFVDNVWFAGSLLITSWSEKKQRRSWTVLLICLNVIFFPIPLLIIAIASILSAPVLPLFTLPIFFIGFPRPTRFWSAQPGSVQANICADSIYYKQLLRPVSEAFSHLIKFGVVDVDSTFGNISSFYLARFQDKTLWIQVLESGFGYTSIAIKGLELQETSCHALETTRLEDAFDMAFENIDADVKCLRTNPYIFTASATPLGTDVIESYSDAKNSLAGIIDQPDFMKDLRKDFLKSLTWLLVHHVVSFVTKNKVKKHASNSVAMECDSTVDTDRLHTPSISAGNGTVQQISDVNVTDLKATEPVSNPGSKISLRSDSIVSFTSLLSSDDQVIVDSKPKPKKANAFKMTKRENTQKQWSSQLSYRDDSGIIDNILSDIYDPAIDQGKTYPGIEDAKNKSTKQMLNFGIQKSSIVLYDKRLHNDDLFLQLIPQRWIDIPLFPDDLEDAVRMFDNDWLQHCVASASFKNNAELKPSQHALTSLMKLVLACDALVNVTGVPGKDYSLLTKHHLHQVYSNEIPWSPMLDWLNERKDLHAILIKSYRYAVKLLIDEISLGPVEDWSELSDYFSDYDQNWFIGSDTEANWEECINQGKPFLFSLNFNKAMKESRARVLSKQEISFHVAEIDAAAVRGLWANLTFELIYATNDDEERYSAQAHLPFFRNLVIQTADPPLGYPILSSSPITVSTLPI